MAEERQGELWTAPERWLKEPRWQDNSRPTGEFPASAGWRRSTEPMPPTGTGPASAAGDATYAPPEAPSPLPLDPESPPPSFDRPLFQNYQAKPRLPERIPNFGHLLILGTFLLFGFLCAIALTQFALHQHMFGIASLQKASMDIHYTLGSEMVLYVLTLLACLIFFPIIWHKGFFAGVQWNGRIAIQMRWRLISAAFACLLLAAASTMIAPGPANAPIDKIFRAPGAAWLLFVFGVTFAPFFEEMFFRGFLLPALCTSVDWFREKIANQPQRTLGPNGHPVWSLTAMTVGAIATSIPFAMMHAEQTGYSIGPFILLAGVSMVLCAVRLSTRSLAASTTVHACYNFTLFAVMLVGTHGFKHLS